MRSVHLTIPGDRKRSWEVVVYRGRSDARPRGYTQPRTQPTLALRRQVRQHTALSCRVESLGSASQSAKERHAREKPSASPGRLRATPWLAAWHDPPPPPPIYLYSIEYS
eukprot:7039881-Prymnesium_polylepis.1